MINLPSIKLASYVFSWLKKGDGPTLITKLMSQDAHHIICFHEKRFLNFYDFYFIGELTTLIFAHFFKTPFLAYCYHNKDSRHHLIPIYLTTYLPSYGVGKNR